MPFGRFDDVLKSNQPPRSSRSTMFRTRTPAISACTGCSIARGFTAGAASARYAATRAFLVSASSPRPRRHQAQPVIQQLTTPC
jgi:hypothetical protein